MSPTAWNKEVPAEIDAGLRDWLLESGSLTARVRGTCPDRFVLHVLRECTAAPEDVPQGIWQDGTSLHLREVTLNCGDEARIFARTLYASTATSGEARWLSTLGSMPLGDRLFDAGGKREGGFEIARLVPGDTLHAHIVAQLGREFGTIWARRARVRLHGEILLICECFLPGLI